MLMLSLLANTRSAVELLLYTSCCCYIKIVSTLHCILIHRYSAKYPMMVGIGFAQMQDKDEANPDLVLVSRQYT